MKNSLMIAASFVALTVGHAVAGIADSALPVLLPGSTTLHLYSVVGAMGGSGLGAYFSCTSTATVPIQSGGRAVRLDGWFAQQRCRDHLP